MVILKTWEQEIGTGCEDVRFDLKETNFDNIEALKSEIKAEISATKSIFEQNYEQFENGGEFEVTQDSPGYIVISTSDNKYPEEHWKVFKVTNKAGNYIPVDLSDLIAYAKEG